MSDNTIRDTLILNGERVASEDMKRFWKDRPDPDFSVKRNEEVIKRSIARAEAHRKAAIKAKQEGLGERVNAITSYIKYLDKGGSKKAEDYFGRKTLAELQAKKTITLLQEAKASGKKLWKVINTE